MYLSNICSAYTLSYPLLISHRYTFPCKSWIPLGSGKDDAKHLICDKIDEGKMSVARSEFFFYLYAFCILLPESDSSWEPILNANFIKVLTSRTPQIPKYPIYCIFPWFENWNVFFFIKMEHVPFLIQVAFKTFV